MKLPILLLLVQMSLFAQDMSLYVGYTGYSLSEQKGLFSHIVNRFNSDNDIIIPIQKNLPSNIILGSKFALYSSEKLDAGISFSYGKTNSYALYGDVLGNIDFRAKFTMMLVGVFVEKNFIIDESMIFSLGMNLSIGSYDYQFTAGVTYPQYPQYNSGVSDSYDGTLYSAEPYVILDINIFGNLYFSTHIGYRGAVSEEENKFSGHPKVDAGGYVIMIGAGYRL